jgi:hypothetical protein
MTICRSLPNPLHHRRTDAGLEWLVTNGLGGYASGAVSGVMTRRHHGVLVAALPIVDAKRNADSDYLASCKDGNRYHVYENEKGRVVVDKQ